jgi:hypothetical protein
LPILTLCPEGRQIDRARLAIDRPTATPCCRYWRHHRGALIRLRPTRSGHHGSERWWSDLNGEYIFDRRASGAADYGSAI